MGKYLAMAAQTSTESRVSGYVLAAFVCPNTLFSMQGRRARFWRVYAKSQLFSWYKNAEKGRLNAALNAYEV